MDSEKAETIRFGLFALAVTTVAVVMMLLFFSAHRTAQLTERAMAEAGLQQCPVRGNVSYRWQKECQPESPGMGGRR